MIQLSYITLLQNIFAFGAKDLKVSGGKSLLFGFRYILWEIRSFNFSGLFYPKLLLDRSYIIVHVHSLLKFCLIFAIVLKM